MKEKIREIALKYNLQIIYAFGSRAKEALGMLEGKIPGLPAGLSDLDIGIKPSDLSPWRKKSKSQYFSKTYL